MSIGRAVEQGGAQRPAGALEPRHLGGEAQVDAARSHGVGEGEADLAVEAAQEELAAVELGDLAADAVGDRGELRRDVAAADDHDALGAVGEMEHVIGGDRELPTRELVPEGASAGGDQHVVGVDGAIADRDRVRRGEARAALEHLDAGVVEQPAVDAVEPRDLLVLVRDQGGPGEGGLAQAPAEAGRVLDLVAYAGGVDQELLGDAADVDAGAAEPGLLGQRDPRAGRGGHPRRAHAAAAAADDEEVEAFRQAVVL